MKRNKIACAFIVVSALSMSNPSNATDPQELLVLGGGGLLGSFVLYKVWRFFDTSLSAQVSKAKLQQELATVSSRKQLYLDLKKHQNDELRDEFGLPRSCKSAALKFLVTHTEQELHEVAREFNRLFPVKPKANKIN